MNKLMVLATISLASNFALAAKWDKVNNPSFFNVIANSPMRFDFTALPLAATLKDDRLGWSETYWPSNKGGIAYRWSSPNPTPFKYKLHPKEEVLRMSEEELSQLSPSELYDLAQGDYDYRLTKKVLGKYKAEDAWWEGICHGWSLAALNYPEPAKTVVINKDGVKVPFGSSDVKGLLAMHDAFNSQGMYARIGGRCKIIGKVEGEAFPEDGPVPPPKAADANLPECVDVNAGAFHLVLSNMIGLNSQGFVADVDRFNDIWNQPVIAYKSEIVGEVSLSGLDVKNGVSKKIQVKTLMTYGDELEFYSEEEVKKGTVGFVSKEPVTGTPAQTNGTKNYEYILELDMSGKIIGGEWITESRPDMLWMKKKDPSFNDGKFMRGVSLSGLNKIYRPVQRPINFHASEPE